jgi:allantoinase
MDNQLYEYSPIVARPPLKWPNNARVAFYVGVNIEHFEVDKPSTSIFGGTSMLAPDPLNYGWREYGVRVGIWRMMEALDKYRMRASVLLNADCCKRYPQIIEAGKERNWAWLAHGRNNSTLQSGMNVEAERKYLREVVDVVAQSTGQQIKGWLGPALSETFETPRLLKELGLSYVLDWCADDQPFPLQVPGMMSVPYAIELNDITMFVSKGMSGEDFYRAVVDQFDQLFNDGRKSGRVMALGLHPFIINQPFRHKYLDKALNYISKRSGVWLTTSDEIAAYFQKHYMPKLYAGART